MLNKEYYSEEIKLIEKQNNVETELYPLVAGIIQPTLKNLSKRYVFGRQRSSMGQIYYGLSNFPDIVILDKSYENKSRKSIKIEDWRQLRGCVEVKNLKHGLMTEEEIRTTLSNKPMHITREMGQLIGDLLWYKKVIYTNGLQWRFLSITDDDNNELANRIIEVVNKRIKLEEAKHPFDWWENIEMKDGMLNYTDICLAKDCIQEWDKFIKRVNNIKW